MTERFFKTKFGFFSQQRETQSVPNRVLWNTNESTKELQDQRKGRRHLRKDIEAEFCANPWSNVLALQKMDKKTRSLEKSCGNESWRKVQKRRPNIKKSVGSKSDKNIVE